MADALKREQGVDVRVTDGGKGEFTVLVDGREVVRGDSACELPSADEVVNAIRSVGQPTGAGN